MVNVGLYQSSLWKIRWIYEVVLSVEGELAV